MEDGQKIYIILSVITQAGLELGSPAHTVFDQCVVALTTAGLQIPF